jgi:phage shock protein A
MGKKPSNKKKLEAEVAELKTKIEDLEKRLKEAAHHDSPWEAVKNWYAKA